MKYFFNLLGLFILVLTANAQQPSYVITAPAGSIYTHIDRKGKTVISNGRFVTPGGNSYTVAPHPYGLALSSDGTIAVTANSGVEPLAITILRNLQSGKPIIQQVPPGATTDKGVLASVFMGLAISPDNKMVYVAGGQENKVFIFDLANGNKIGAIDCNPVDSKTDYSHGYIGDMVLSHDGRQLYAVDQIGFRLVIIDLVNKKVSASIPVGRYPFGVALSQDERTVYIANVGMYQYNLIKKKKNGQWNKGEIDFPAFAYGSKEAEDGILNDSIQIPGLGPMNSDESFSVWAIGLGKKGKTEIKAKIKTGTQVGQMVDGFPAVGGSSPNSIVATDRYVFISNGNNDNITVLDARRKKIIKQISLNPDDRLEHLRGIIPFGLAASPDGKRIYVAEAGLNAIGVIDVATLNVIGHIPAGWFPAKLKVTPDGSQLVIANAKGFGCGPNGGAAFTPGPEGSYIGSLMKGTVQVVRIPTDDALPMFTRQVIENNFNFSEVNSKSLDWRKDNPVPAFPDQKESPIKHFVFISKENRTFDEIFGQVAGVEGDTTIARYGRNVTFTNKDKNRKVENATVMPNHLELARKFCISDNFYVDSDVSADGHRWLANTYPNEWVESSAPAAYGGSREYREDSKAPGNLGISGSAGAVYPEDYNESGTLWDHLARNHISFHNFGFGLMFSPADYGETYKYGGIKQVANFPLPAPLWSNSSLKYPTFNTAIPDQFRIDIFEKEYNELWGPGKDTLPHILTIILPNDHGAGERPDAGYPFRESYMADNDLALGRIVEFLSHTPEWKNMAIIITEDDAQNGVDHVDAHRSVLMLISPYAKRNSVSHVHYSFGSIFKTFWNTLGIPYLNQYDAGASDMADMFTGKPDFTSYTALPVDARIFDPQKALDPLNEKFDWKQLKKGSDIDDPEDMIRQSKEQDEWRKEGMTQPKKLP